MLAVSYSDTTGPLRQQLCPVKGRHRDVSEDTVQAALGSSPPTSSVELMSTRGTVCSFLSVLKTEHLAQSNLSFPIRFGHSDCLSEWETVSPLGTSSVVYF